MKKLWLLCILILSILLVSCGKEIVQTILVPNEPTSLNPTGVIPSSTEDYNNLVAVYPKSSGDNLPAAIDLTSKFPLPGNQSPQGSCVAWATAYAYKSYQEGLEHKWNINSNTFSPAYVYNQINRGVDNGSSIIDALELLQNQGVAPEGLMPYNKSDYLTQPSENARLSAKNYKIANYGKVSYENMRNLLAENTPIILSVPVYEDFDNINDENKVYDTIKGNSRGNHAITIIGYDDNLQAFKFINSWGQNWGMTNNNGIKGYGYISYNLVKNYTYERYSMIDAVSQVIQYSLTVDSNTGGTVNPNTGIYNKDTAITIQATPSSGYRFVKWEGDNSSSSNPLSLTMDSNKNIKAIFEEIPAESVYLTVSSSAGGNANRTSGSYTKNSTVSITATPNNGYRFVRWEGNSSSTSITINLTMDTNKSVRAIFEEIPAENMYLTINSSNGGYTNKSSGSYTKNSTISITATPNNGYRFLRWEGDISSTSSTINLTMNTNKNIRAVFEELYYLENSQSTTGQHVTNSTIMPNDVLRMTATISGDVLTIRITKIDGGTFKTSGTLKITTAGYLNNSPVRYTFNVKAGDTEYTYTDSLSKYDLSTPGYGYPKYFYGRYEINNNVNDYYWVGSIKVSKK